MQQSFRSSFISPDPEPAAQAGTGPTRAEDALLSPEGSPYPDQALLSPEGYPEIRPPDSRQTGRAQSLPSCFSRDSDSQYTRSSSTAYDPTDTRSASLGVTPVAPPTRSLSLSTWEDISEWPHDGLASTTSDTESDCKSPVAIPPIAPEGVLRKSLLGVWCAGLTQTGLYPDKPDHVNQDRFEVHMGLGAGSFKEGSYPAGCHLFAVLDGHGPYGHEVAEHVIHHLPADVAKTLVRHHQDSEDGSSGSSGSGRIGKEMQDSVESLLYRAYTKVDEGLAREAIDGRFSGTTAVCAWLAGETLHVANTGDSRAVLGRRQGGVLRAVDLTVDQTPFRVDERERVEKSGARILTSGEIHGQVRYASPEDYTADDPPRCYLPGHPFPGTAFTRSIGDQVAAGIGVIAEPEVSEHTIEEGDEFLIVASDGIWEFITSQEACEIVAACDDPYQAATKLIESAWEAWFTEDVRADDITVIVVMLNAGVIKKGQASSPKPPGLGKGGGRHRRSFDGRARPNSDPRLSL